ncbi:hypothetical protein BKK81_17875 [Cupriavidus sp. USMAHM13]|nr:hypothetical protein BKK81_17875 [Cupriavidus sp. USMAHM13]
MALRVKHYLSILLRERSLLRLRQYFQHDFRWATQPHAQRGYHERAVDEDRACKHRIEQSIVGELGVA